MTKRTLYSSILAALLLIGIGLAFQYFLPVQTVAACLGAAPVTMFDITIGCGFPIGIMLVKTALLLILGRFLVTPLVARLMGFGNQIGLLKDQQLDGDGNDSSSIVNAFAFLALGWLVFTTPYTVPLNYLANLLVRIPHAYLWTLVLTALASRFHLNIKSVDEYVENFQKKHTNAAAIWTGISAFVAAFMVSGIR